jgi:uncharacterized protein
MRPTSVRTLDASGFEDASASLMRLVQTSYMPELLIGIPAGGLAVAQAMWRTAPGMPAVMPLTCRYPATEPTSRVRWLPNKLQGSPRWRTDLLLYAGIQRISAGCGSRLSGHLPDQQESMAISSVVATGAATKLLVVDDAVGCGMTLTAALHALRCACPPHIEIRSAAITVTLDDPPMAPDYALYRNVLCRFPWSFDAE